MGKRRERTVDHTRAGSMVVTESEWTYSHRHSTVVAIHRWSNGRTNGQSGGGISNADMEGVSACSWSAFMNVEVGMHS